MSTWWVPTTCADSLLKQWQLRNLIMRVVKEVFIKRRFVAISSFWCETYLISPVARVAPVLKLGSDKLAN